MNCLHQMIGYLSYAAETLGLYEPQINAQEARDRLSAEKLKWVKCQSDRNEIWNEFQVNNSITIPPFSLVNRAITHLQAHDIQNGVAVDLGCGVSPTVVHLLERGWKVYAVDSSSSVLATLTQKISLLEKNWIENGQLVLVNQSIEDFKFPEKVHLITAIESIPYCDPEQIDKIFLKIKNALFPQGVFVANLFPYHHPAVDNMLRGMFGAWLTTRNVVEAIIRTADFTSSSVTIGKSATGIAPQIHIFAEV